MRAAITLDMLRAASSAEFPVIDLGGYMRGGAGALDRAAAQLCDALETIGFLIVVNHGITAELTDGIVAEAQRFHALPLAEKMKAPSSEKRKLYRRGRKGCAEDTEIRRVHCEASAPSAVSG